MTEEDIGSKLPNLEDLKTVTDSIKFQKHQTQEGGQIKAYDADGSLAYRLIATKESGIRLLDAENNILIVVPHIEAKTLTSTTHTQNNESKTWQVTFSKPFNNVPAIVATPQNDDGKTMYINVSNSSATGCTVTAKNTSGSQAWLTVNLIAVERL